MTEENKEVIVKEQPNLLSREEKEYSEIMGISGGFGFRLDFEKTGDVYQVKNKKLESLGKIVFYKPWDKWVWDIEGIIMEEECLQELLNFIKQI